MQGLNERPHESRHDAADIQHEIRTAATGEPEAGGCVTTARWGGRVAHLRQVEQVFEEHPQHLGV